jgi:hypothetical protein
LDAGLDIAALHQVEGADLLGQVATFEQTAVVGLFDIGRQFSEERLSLTIGFRSTVELPAATPVVEVRNRSFPPLLATSVGQMFNRSLPAPTWFRVFEVHNRNVQDLPGADLGTVLAIQNDIDGSAPQDLIGDFDVNGVVELADFFLFAQAFGSSDLRFDLNGNDEVELGDFFVFADNFGRRTGP